MAAGNKSKVYIANLTTGSAVPTWDDTYLVSDVNSFDNTIDTSQLDKTAFGDDYSKFEEGLKNFTASLSVRSLPTGTLIDETTKGLKGLMNYAVKADRTTQILWIRFHLQDNFYIETNVVIQSFNPSSTVDGQSGIPSFSFQNAGTPTLVLA